MSANERKDDGHRDRENKEKHRDKEGENKVLILFSLVSAVRRARPALGKWANTGTVTEGLRKKINDVLQVEMRNYVKKWKCDDQDSEEA